MRPSCSSEQALSSIFKKGANSFSVADLPHALYGVFVELPEDAVEFGKGRRVASLLRQEAQLAGNGAGQHGLVDLVVLLRKVVARLEDAALDEVEPVGLLVTLPQRRARRQLEAGEEGGDAPEEDLVVVRRRRVGLEDVATEDRRLPWCAAAAAAAAAVVVVVTAAAGLGPVPGPAALTICVWLPTTLEEPALGDVPSDGAPGDAAVQNGADCATSRCLYDKEEAGDNDACEDADDEVVIRHDKDDEPDGKVLPAIDPSDGVPNRLLCQVQSEHKDEGADDVDGEVADGARTGKEDGKGACGEHQARETAASTDAVEEDGVDVAEVVGHTARQTSENIGDAVGDKLAVCVQVVLVYANGQRRYVEWHMEDGEECECELSGHRGPQRRQARLAEVKVGVEAPEGCLGRLAHVKDPVVSAKRVEGDEPEEDGEEERREPVSNHEPGLSEELECFEIPLEAGLGLELRRHLQARFDEEDADATDAPNEDVTGKEANKNAEAEVAQQHKDDASEDRREGKGDNRGRDHRRRVGLVAQGIDDDGDENVVEGHDLDHHGAVTALEYGATEGVDELADDAGDKEHRHAVATKVGKDGVRGGKDDEAVGDAVEDVEEHAQNHGRQQTDGLCTGRDGVSPGELARSVIDGAEAKRGRRRSHGDPASTRTKPDWNVGPLGRELAVLLVAVLVFVVTVVVTIVFIVVVGVSVSRSWSGPTTVVSKRDTAWARCRLRLGAHELCVFFLLLCLGQYTVAVRRRGASFVK
ncbi:hypothetical protein L7F22_034913 [Adiantum nelumboides]|nr:hypothetical protein [Adiantum nelumboides]